MGPPLAPKRVSRGFPSSLPGGAAIVGSAEPLERMKRNLQIALRCSHFHAPWPRERFGGPHGKWWVHRSLKWGPAATAILSGLRAAWGVAGLRVRTLTNESGGGKQMCVARGLDST